MWNELKAIAGIPPQSFLKYSKSATVKSITKKLNVPASIKNKQPISQSTKKLTHVNNGENINDNNDKKKVKKKKFFYIPLIHLELILELMKFHYHWRIQIDIAKKEFEKTHSNILETPLYLRYCSKIKYVPCKEADKIGIDGIKYAIIWWNNVGKRKCNAFCISIGDEKREYFY